MDKAPGTLYICYFGLREPLVQTQVLPYLREIVKGGFRVHLLTFEPEMKQRWPAAESAAMRAELLSQGIEWDALPYHKRPSALATAYDVLNGMMYVQRKVARNEIDILHGRIHVATLMGALARKLSTRKPKLLFDIRGFFPEEYTDAGVWPRDGSLYRTVKRVERWLMQEADGFVVLTEKARSILFGEPSGEHRPVEVIPCCVDLVGRFGPAQEAKAERIRAQLGLDGRFVLTHVGALGGLYMTREIVELLAAARERDPSTFALFLTQSDPAELTLLLNSAGFTERDMFISKVEPKEIPAYMSVADAGISFVQATYATQSRSPTKIPEYLAAGIPIIANAGVGDVDSMIRAEGVGVLVDDFSPDAYIKALDALEQLGDVSAACRAAASRLFDLRTVGGPRYRRLYEKLLGSSG